MNAGKNFFLFVESNPVKYIDPYGLEKDKCPEDPCAYLLPREYPNGFDPATFLKNMKEAQKNSVVWWINQVKPKGNWDYKVFYGWRHGGADVGNFNYGATGRAVGFSKQILMRILGGYPYGDAKDDMDQIIWGVAYYNCMRQHGRI